VVAVLALVAAVGGCAGARTGATPDGVASSSSSPSTAPTTEVADPGPTTTLPICTDEQTSVTHITPASRLPSEVPGDWQLRAAADLHAVDGYAPWVRGATAVVLDEDGLVVDDLLISGSRQLEYAEPIEVRGTSGEVGRIGGRSTDSSNLFVQWDEGGHRWSAAVADTAGRGVHRAELVELLAPLELSGTPEAPTVEDPTGRVEQIATRPAEGLPTTTLLIYDAPDGTAVPPMSDPDPGRDTTDSVLVTVEQYAGGGSGIHVLGTSPARGQLAGLRLEGAAGERTLRGEQPPSGPIAMGAAVVPDGTPSVAVQVVGAPSRADEDTVLASVDVVTPDDDRLRGAEVRVGRLALPTCRPDGP
jgi:hypothetical protein